MTYSLNDIAKEVRVAMDTNDIEGEPLSLDDNTLMIADIIKSKIEPATRMVENACPVGMLESGSNFGDAVYWNTDNSGWIILPDNFMRLISFKMSDWRRTVRKAITPDDAEYLKQSSRWGGIKGNTEKPVCAVVLRSVGKVLEFYCCDSQNATVEQGVYLPKPEVVDGYIEICERCHDAVIYQTAGLVAQALAMESAGTFIELAKGLMTL